MTIQGEFRDVDDRLVSVLITSDAVGEDITIGENGLFFTGDPITIETSCDDTFTHIIQSKATINLATKEYVGANFFADNAKDIDVTIKINNSVVFYGYVDPNTFNQPYIAGYNEFSITGLDRLSVLKYYNYNDCDVNNYQTKVNNADTKTFKAILDSILDLSNNMMFYDNSKGITSSRTANLFDDLNVYDLLFYGEDYDDVWTQEEVLETIMKYLNLHILVIGNSFYVFDWNSVKSGKQNWRYITANSNAAQTISHNNKTLAYGLFADSDTNITISDVYNQIKVKCDLEKQDTLIENPLDDKALVSPYSGKQLYCTEYISEGTGDTAHDAMLDMIHDNSTNYDEAKTVDWYFQVKQHPEWKMYIDGAGGHTIFDITGIKSGGEYINQWKIPYYLRQNSCIPAIFSFGSVEHKGGPVTDNSPISQIDMKNYLYISVNGTVNDYNGFSNQVKPDQDDIQNHAPVLEYTGTKSGGIFSPVDDTTTNYLVFSGKMLFQPIQYESGKSIAKRENTFYELLTQGLNKSEGKDAEVPYYESETEITNNLIKTENNGEGRYYTRKFYEIERPSDTGTPPYSTSSFQSLQPWTKDKNQGGFAYRYSAIGEGNDTFSKLPILECELIIGNKRLIERDMDDNGNSTFEWVELGDEPPGYYVDENGDTKEYTITTFSLGVDPKIDFNNPDKIIGTEFNIQNTISYQMNIDATGTAIPIKRSDNLSGKVQFKILGLINSSWKQITRRHPSFWRHTKWTTGTYLLLAHTENVIIQEFECKVYSDNSLNDTNVKDKDLVYASDENDKFINIKDDIEFDLVTQLSADECRAKGITTSILMNAVGNSYAATNPEYSLTLAGLYDANTGEAAKPEEHYVNQYYLQYCEPKIVLETTIHDNFTMFNDLFHSNVLDKDFHVLSMSRNLRFNRNTLRLREI